MSLLTIVQNAAGRLGLDIPTSVISNTNENVVSMLRLANQEGKAMARRYPWQVLTKEQTFVTTAAAVQTGAVPSDFDWIIPDTMYNRTNKRPVSGPVNASEWQAAQATLITRVVDTFRMRGDSILITPTPAAGETIAFEYISKRWVDASPTDGVGDKGQFSIDTDVPVIDDEIITLGIVWRFLQRRGLDYSEAMLDYEREFNQAAMRDGGKPRLNMDRGRSDRIPQPPLMPETLEF
jgi:hypothetical protein